MISIKKRGAQRSPPTCNEVGPNSTKAKEKLQELKRIAFNQAMRCRWDPALGKTHLEYYDAIEIILKEYE